MKKVLFVFNHPAPYKVRLLNEMANFIDLTVIFERDKNKDRSKAFYFENKYKFKTIKIKGIPIGKENIFSFGVLNHIKQNKYDLIIMNGYSQLAEMLAINYLIKHHIPYCLYINGGIIKQKECLFRRKLKEKYISHADFYLSPDKESNKYLSFYKAKEDRIFNYPYSTIYKKEMLEKPITSEEKIELKKELNISASHVYVSSGQLIKRKNYLSLIKHWPDNYEKLLLIMGDGKQRKEIEKYLKQNSIKNVKLLGFLSRNEMFKYYKIADAFIFPSNEDIYGHVVNEAMSQGLCIISTPNVNASKKLIHEGINGYIISSLDDPKFYSSLEDVLKLDKQNAIDEAHKNTIEEMVRIHKEILA